MPSKDLRSFKVVIKISLWSHFLRNTYCKNHFYSLRRALRKLCLQSEKRSFSSKRRRFQWKSFEREKKAMWMEFLWYRWRNPARDRHSRDKNYMIQWQQNFWDAVGMFPLSFLSLKNINQFLFSRRNCHNRNGLANGRDSRRKGCTSNSIVMKFIAATWLKATTCENTVLIISEIIQLRILWNF